MVVLNSPTQGRRGHTYPFGLRGVLAFLIALFAVACTVSPVGSEQEPSDQPADSSDTRSTSPTSIAGLDTSFLDDIKADESVTRAEMEQAYLAFFACLEDNGGSGEYAFNLDYDTGLSYNVGFGEVSDHEVAEGIVSRCKATYIGDLPILFGEEHSPSADAAERQLESIRSCIAGVDPELGEQAEEIEQPDLMHDLAEGSDHGVEVTACVNTNGEGYTDFG